MDELIDEWSVGNSFLFSNHRYVLGSGSYQ